MNSDNSEEKQMRFWIEFRGTRNGEYIDADTLHSAKWIFALKNGLHSLSYIKGRKV